MSHAAEPVHQQPFRVFQLALHTQFRGIRVREGLVFRGPAGWGEWSPFLEYTGTEIVPWLAAAREAAFDGWPAPVRDRVPVNVTIPVVEPQVAHDLAAGSGCRTAKVKVADPRATLAEDQARVEATHAGLGAGGKVRVDANGAWTVDEAMAAIRALRHLDLEYVEQPCATVEELAELRSRLASSGIDVPIAADESIRRSGDPERVVALAAADIAVLKVQPLGGVRRCLELADTLGLPVVVSSALESSIGLAAGVALAAALPELPFACGLATSNLFVEDLTADALVPIDGHLPVHRPEVTDDDLTRADAPSERIDWWRQRLLETEQLARQTGAHR
ncbi:o-succinylbenzoate synthase [Enemella sp. A6]|uniref:o-succinylbenzoate synthase n=1 Tax=Enemella sp. A6 TaxID=3440152 RepID=UPI003EB7E2BA